MRSRSSIAPQCTQKNRALISSRRYAPLGLLVMMTSCTGLQNRTGYLAELRAGPVRNYQIQVHTTEDKHAASSMADAVAAWWEKLEEGDRRVLYGARELPVEIKWLDPYYRVRIGHFRSREEALGMLVEVAEAFPAALLVPDTINETYQNH